MFRKIASAYKSSFSGLSRETWLLSTVMLINRSGTMAVPFMGLYVVHYLHRPASDAGIIISLFGAGSILGAIAGGKLTDMIGFRPVQIFSSVLGGLLFLLFSTITHFKALCSLTILISFVSEAFRPANFTAIAAYAAPGLQTRSYSLNRLAINIGWSVGSTLGGIISAINYQLLFVVDGVVNIIAGLFILWLLPSAKSFRKKVAEKAKDLVVRMPWQDAYFIRFILLNTVFVTCFFLMFRVVQLFWKDSWHIGEAQIGLVLGLNGLIVAILEMVMINRIQHRRSPVYFIIVGTLFTAASYLLLLVPGTTPVLLAILAVVIITFGEMFALPFINTVVMSRTNEFNRGQYAAGNTLSWSVAQLVGPAAGFYIAQHMGYNFLWITLIVLLLLCAYGFKLLERQQRKNEQ
ncbi:MAG: MFS transporter [Chitinophagaceae bacterium]